jgi:DNA repair photolyase
VLVGGRGLTKMFERICGEMWSVTPYAMCDHRCVYCITGVQGVSNPIMAADDARHATRQFVDAAAPASLCLLGAFSDAYPNVEAGTGLTRVVLEELVASDARVTIITKGTTVLRDVDLLALAGARVHVQVSLCTLDEAVLARLDVGAPTGARRLAVVDALLSAGLSVGVNVLPWIPGVTDARALIDAIDPTAEIVFSPLGFGEGRDSMRLLGREYRRPDVWRAYDEAYRAFGHVPNTSWVRPSPPPQENHPLLRLPRLVDEVPVELSTGPSAR